MNRKTKLFIVSILGALLLSSCGPDPSDFTSHQFNIDDSLNSLSNPTSSTSYREPTSISHSNYPNPNYPKEDSLPTSLPKEDPYVDPEVPDYSNPTNVTYAVTDIKKGKKPTDYQLVAKDDSYYLSLAIELAAEEISKLSKLAPPTTIWYSFMSPLANISVYSVCDHV